MRTSNLQHFRCASLANDQYWFGNCTPGVAHCGGSFYFIVEEQWQNLFIEQQGKHIWHHQQQ